MATAKDERGPVSGRRRRCALGLRAAALLTGAMVGAFAPPAALAQSASSPARPRVPATASSLSGSSPAETSSTQPPTDCAARRKLYLDSQACFERYRTVDGAVKAEGFRRCRNVVDPSPECGPNLPTR